MTTKQRCAADGCSGLNKTDVHRMKSNEIYSAEQSVHTLVRCNKLFLCVASFSVSSLPFLAGQLAIRALRRAPHMAHVHTTDFTH